MNPDNSSNNSPPGGEIVIYLDPGDGPTLNVRLQQETVWLTQAQMVELFGRDQSVISRHLRNLFAEGELPREGNMQKMHIAGADKPVVIYNLDVIISVGYRVKSERGTQFRIWATRVLREHLVRGYTANERRLRELNETIRLIDDVKRRHDLSGDEAKAILAVVTDYTLALDLLDDYDHQRVALHSTISGPVRIVDHAEAHRIVEQLREKFGASRLFGLEKDNSLRGALEAITQTFTGREVYPSLEEKAAHLLYFVVKNHPFVDGNKRIGASLFLWFLEKNGALYREDGSKRIADNALVAMTLLIAESRPVEKEILTRVVVNLINKSNP